MVNIVGILLAAGKSTRFGSNKLLHELKDGKKIAEQSALNLCGASCESIAIVSDVNSLLADVLHKTGLELIENPDAAQGMSTSIVQGILAKNEADGWLIGLSDMPFVHTETIEKLIQVLSQTIENGPSIVAPVYNKQRGHPVLFSRHFYDELICLRGDVGARDIIKNNPQYLKLVTVTDVGVLQDIDVIDDIEQHK